jgi:hypothetical protein
MGEQMSEKCKLRQGLFERWYIFHPHNIVLAWSGSRWVACFPDGLPRETQVCNFATEQEAREACREYGLEPE